MKQKVVVRAIVSRRGRVLLLRRYGGRPAIAGLYELPGGSLHPKEQPVDAIKRSLQIHAGVYPETAHLRDVASFVDPDDRELQYIFILYDVSLPDMAAKVSLDDEYDHYTWIELSEIQQNLITNSTTALLGIGANSHHNAETGRYERIKDGKNTTFIIYSDGGSRGNPGPSASAFLIMDENNKVISQGGKFLGRNDSGMAEYTAVEIALKKAIELDIRRVEFRSDSLMVVNQINGLFAVKNPEFREIHRRVLRLAEQFDRIVFRHVYREYNRMADGLVNKILDDSNYADR